MITALLNRLTCRRKILETGKTASGSKTTQSNPPNAERKNPS